MFEMSIILIRNRIKFYQNMTYEQFYILVEGEDRARNPWYPWNYLNPHMIIFSFFTLSEK